MREEMLVAVWEARKCRASLRRGAVGQTGTRAPGTATLRARAVTCRMVSLDASRGYSRARS